VPGVIKREPITFDTFRNQDHFQPLKVQGKEEDCILSFGHEEQMLAQSKPEQSQSCYYSIPDYSTALFNEKHEKNEKKGQQNIKSLLDHSDLCLLGSKSKHDSPNFNASDEKKPNVNNVRDNGLPQVPVIDRSKDYENKFRESFNSHKQSILTDTSGKKHERVLLEDLNKVQGSNANSR